MNKYEIKSDAVLVKSAENRDGGYKISGGVSHGYITGPDEWDYQAFICQ